MSYEDTHVSRSNETEDRTAPLADEVQSSFLNLAD